MYDFEILSGLLLVNILLSFIYRYLDSKKPTPLSTWEFYSYMFDHKAELKKILDEDNKEIRNNMFDNYLKTRDLIKGQNEKNNTK